jgi:catechol 2,3-dioxygenase-like lactoylglutathione lyase family enzyme
MDPGWGASAGSRRIGSRPERGTEMGVRHIAMVTVQVRDFDGMVAWYRDVLGLGIGWLEAGEFCALTMPGGEAVLALATDHPDRISDRPGTGWTPSLTVDDLDDMVGRLRDQGVQFDAEEEGADEGYRLVRVRDPEGNPIGLTA